MKQLADILSERSQGSRKRVRGDFPSMAHEVAWFLANEFDEPYGVWVRNVTYAGISPESIRKYYDELKGQRYTRRQRIKILVHKMKVHVNPKPVV